jgi:5-methylcytosine-specific restriction endonuclease McrA
MRALLKYNYQVPKYLGKETMAKMYEEAKMCPYCYRTFESGVPRVIDHIVPRSANGMNVSDNLTVCCSKCNYDKNTSSLLEFVAKYPIGNGVFK